MTNIPITVGKEETPHEVIAKYYFRQGMEYAESRVSEEYQKKLKTELFKFLQQYLEYESRVTHFDTQMMTVEQKIQQFLEYIKQK